MYSLYIGGFKKMNMASAQSTSVLVHGDSSCASSQSSSKDSGMHFS